MTNDARRYRPHPDVVAQAVGKELLLVQLADGSTFRLNRTGKAIWGLFVAGLLAAEVTEQLHAELGVSTERLNEDVNALLNKLLQNALLEPSTQEDR